MKLVLSMLTTSLLVCTLSAQSSQDLEIDKSSEIEKLKAKLATLEAEQSESENIQEETPANVHENLTNNKNQEYEYIQPIAIEEAPIERINVDSDGDGYYDDEDECPHSNPGAIVNSVGCEELIDSDGDGVADDLDQCPNTPKGLKVNKNGCELDSDEDGVVDSKDQCPNTSKNFRVDGYGCPQTATLRANFDTNSYALNDSIIADLKEFAQFLKDNVGYQVIIYGYTDSIGDATTNKILSQNRANSIKDGLTRYGISAKRLSSIGKGEAEPIASNMYKDGRAKNRRIEVELLKK